ncbi:hypothetical protein OAH87_06525, partial [Marinomonas sp.]
MLKFLKRTAHLPAKIGTSGLLALSLACLLSSPSQANTREETLIVLSGSSVNSLDIHRTGTNR